MWTKLAKMSVREAMILVAGKPGYGEQPRWFERVAHAANISKRAARSLWNDEIKNPNHWAARAIIREAEAAKQLKEAKRDAEVVANFFNRHAQALSNIDPDFHRESIDAFVEAARALGNRNRT